MPLPSGLNIPVWRTLLADFPDSSLVDHLEFGWPLDYTSHNIPVPTLTNHSPSAISDVHILSFIEKERSFKALLGPFPRTAVCSIVSGQPDDDLPQKEFS